MKKTRGKTNTSITDEKEVAPPEKEIPAVEVKPQSPDSIFSSDKIDKLFNAEDPIQSTNILLQDHFRKVTGNANFDEEKLKAEAEFHINNLVFLKQNFSFDNDTISILMNILGKLIKFKNLNNTNTKPKSKVIQNESQENIDSVDISGNQLPDDTQNQNKNPAINDENQENNKENMDENELENENNNNIVEEEEVDFLFLSKDKLNEFKESLIKENLMPKTKSDFAFANNKNKIRTNGKFLLNLQEINKILKYIQTNFLPYIRMWYFFQNEKRNITERKIEVIINSPNLINMPLSMAVQEKTDEEKITEEEEKKKKMEEEKKLEEENQKKEEEEKKKKEKKKKKKEEESKKLTEEQSKEETYLDLLERLGLNEETKKVIIEKIEELHKEVDGKIDNRKKTLEDKIREIDETVHGKKK